MEPEEQSQFCVNFVYILYLLGRCRMHAWSALLADYRSVT